MKIEKYKKLGLKLTAQRLAILEYLNGNTSHPSANDIYKFVTRKFPTLSFATVYYTLRKLKQKKLIVELNIDTNKKRYDPNITSHNHIICIKCKRLKDIFVNFDIDVSMEQKGGYLIISNHIEFYGYCPKCAKKIKMEV